MKLKLFVADEFTTDVKIINSVLEFEEINDAVIVEDKYEVSYLNQGSLEPILFEDNMIVARGLYGIISYVEILGKRV